jgi:hypothetical protein
MIPCIQFGTGIGQREQDAILRPEQWKLRLEACQVPVAQWLSVAEPEAQGFVWQVCTQAAVVCSTSVPPG